MPIAPATSQSFAADLDRRSGARRPLRVAAVVVLASGQQLSARTVDIGLRALSIQVDQTLPARTPCEVQLSLPVKGVSHSMRLHAQVAHAILSGTSFRIDLTLHDTLAADDMALEQFVVS